MKRAEEASAARAKSPCRQPAAAMSSRQVVAGAKLGDQVPPKRLAATGDAVEQQASRTRRPTTPQRYQRDCHQCVSLTARDLALITSIVISLPARATASAKASTVGSRAAGSLTDSRRGLPRWGAVRAKASPPSEIETRDAELLGHQAETLRARL